MQIHHVRSGSGQPLLLIHGLGGSHRTWSQVAGQLAEHREVIAIDLPGFGESPQLPGPVSVAALADAVAGFVARSGLDGVDVLGSSLGGQIALELRRRGLVGSVVALDPAGFGTPREMRIFNISLRLSMKLVRLLEPVLPALAGNPVTRTLLLTQFSSRPWALPRELVLAELRSFIRSPGSEPTLAALSSGPPQQGAPAGTGDPIVIVWGTRDRVLFPSQARRAVRAFPGAELQWLRGCGHCPQWDMPDVVVRLVLRATTPA
jgi:pimeloyl-ACP methyl ester carboxylesterase